MTATPLGPLGRPHDWDDDDGHAREGGHTRPPPRSPAPSRRPGSLPPEVPGGTSIDPGRLCEVASSLFAAIAREQARRDGRWPDLPAMLGPVAPAPCPCRYTPAELREAERFLLRLGVIEPRGPRAADTPDTP